MESSQIHTQTVKILREHARKLDALRAETIKLANERRCPKLYAAGHAYFNASRGLLHLALDLAEARDF